MVKKLFGFVLVFALLLSFSASQISVSAEIPADLDLSALSELNENKTDAAENYAYTWTLEEIDNETVRTSH